ncbi:cyclase [Plantactinospora sp. GCM10030261]|uniref:SRPBCC family protein n=1 Tax=Plantactinospora sp. GCM10030261 TaxID=3273420 RepID=UPI0036157F48
MTDHRKWLALAAVGAAGVTGAAVVRRRRQGAGGAGPHRDRASVRVVTVDRPAEAVRELWRDAGRLSVVLDRPVAVEQVDERRWRCRVGDPAGPRTTVEVTSGDDERVLRWTVTEGAAAHQGRLDLTPAPGDRGTELRVELRYARGGLGHGVAVLAGRDPDQQARTLLRRAKSLLECGQVISTIDDPSGRGPIAERMTRTMREKLTVGGRP